MWYREDFASLGGTTTTVLKAQQRPGVCVLQTLNTDSLDLLRFSLTTGGKKQRLSEQLVKLERSNAKPAVKMNE